MVVTPEVVREFLGVPKFRTEKEVAERVKRREWRWAGVDAGGRRHHLHRSYPHAGRQAVHHDGHLGEVMQESMTAALTWTRANGERYGIDPDFFASRTFTSTFRRRCAEGRSFGGRGDGDGAGQLAEWTAGSRGPGHDRGDDPFRRGAANRRRERKGAGAKRAGIKEVLLPADNEPNAVADLTPEILGDLKITYVRTLDEVLEHALEKEPVAPAIVPPEPKGKRVEVPRAIH